MQIRSAYQFASLPARSANGTPPQEDAATRPTGPDRRASAAGNATALLRPQNSTDLQLDKTSASAPSHPAANALPSARSPEIRTIFGQYDLHAISPDQIDQLTSELKATRHDDLGFVMGLEREGSAYRQDMEASGRVYGIGDTEFDATAPIDLIAKTRDDLQMARRYGQDTGRLTAQLTKLEEAQTMRSPRLTPSPTPKQAETLVLYQAQRLWIEQEP